MATYRIFKSSIGEIVAAIFLFILWAWLLFRAAPFDGLDWFVFLFLMLGHVTVSAVAAIDWRLRPLGGTIFTSLFLSIFICAKGNHDLGQEGIAIWLVTSATTLYVVFVERRKRNVGT
jgi:hypothetical protein